MKILFVVSWYSAYGLPVHEGIFHYEQALALKRFTDVDVAIYFPFDTSIQDDFSDEIEYGVRVFRRRSKKNKYVRYLGYINDYKRIKKDYNPDIIHAHVAGAAGMVTFFWKLFFCRPYILTEHAPIELMHLGKIKHYLLHKVIYKNSQKRICVSNDLREKLEKYYPKQNFDVIYNGVFSPTEQIVVENDWIEKKHKINCAIVAAFYDKEIKGYQYLLPAIKELSKSGIDICLHICGGGKYLDYYKNLAAELEISERCVFYGQISKSMVYTIVSQMNFVLSASLFESAGVSVEEAMLLGKPLVVTCSGGASSLVTKETAIVVDKGSSEALVSGIKDMINQYDKFDSIVIKNYATDNFDIESVSIKYLNLYKEVCCERS